MANGPDYTVKELLSDFVIPRLEKIEELLRLKADSETLRDLAIRVKTLEDDTLHPAAVKELVSNVLQDSSTRGWTRRERWFGASAVLASIAALALQAWAQFGG